MSIGDLINDVLGSVIGRKYTTSKGEQRLQEQISDLRQEYRASLLAFVKNHWNEFSPEEQRYFKETVARAHRKKKEKNEFIEGMKWIGGVIVVLTLGFFFFFSMMMVVMAVT